MPRLNVNVSKKEHLILKRFCQQEERTQSDVLRELVRGLEQKIIDNTKLS